MCEINLDLLQETDIGRGLEFDAHDIAVLTCLLRELRDMTLSRRSFTESTRFLRRLARERESPRLVHDPDR